MRETQAIAETEDPSGRIARAVEALSEGLAVFNAEDKLVFSNRSFREAHPGLEHLLQPGALWSIFLAEAGRRGVGRGLAQLDAHLATGIDREFIVQTEQPGEKWARLGLRPMADGGFVVTHRDVTEIRAAADLRAEADEELRELLDACAPQIAISRVGDGGVLYHTPAWEAVFGKVDSERRLYVEPKRRSDFLAELLPTGRLDGFEVDLYRADGTVLPAHVSGRIADFRGEQAIVSSVQDMTALYEQRDQVERTNQRLLDAIEALDQGFALFDAADSLLLANRRWARENARIADVAQPGATNDAIVSAAAARGLEPRLAGRVAGEAIKPGAVSEIDLPDGRAFAVSRRATSDAGFVLAWRDVSDRRAAEAELTRRREAAHQNEKLTALGELLAGVAHELNNPLSVVVGHALMLKEDALDEATARRIDKISASAERCAKIVKAFLSMARERPLTPAPTRIEQIVDTALDVTAHGLRADGVEIETRLDAAAPAVLVDADQIAQVLVNLLTNAGQALHGLDRPGRIVLSSRADPAKDQVVLSVADNGPGVPSGLRARIFEPFFTTKGVGEGTGIGLALSHRIVVAHGGTMDVRPGPEGGAAFCVALPAAHEGQAPTQRSAETAVEGRRALLVEDEDEVAELIEELLARAGLSTRRAGSAEEALRLLGEDEQFHIVLSDLKMPGMGGRAFYEELLRKWPSLAARTAFVTGDAMSADAAAIRSVLGRPLLEKPIAPKDLTRLLSDLLAQDWGPEP